MWNVMVELNGRSEVVVYIEANSVGGCLAVNITH